MRRTVTAIIAGALWFGVATTASAASLGRSTEAPTIESSFAIVDFLNLSPDGELSSFGMEVDFTDGVTPTGLTTIDFVAGFSLADPTTGLSGFLDVSDENGQFLVGDLQAIGFTEDIVELEFGNLTGAGAGSFGLSVLALIAFDDSLGSNPFAAFNDGDALTASVSISNISAIPLPAGLPLLLSGLIGLGFVARGRFKTVSRA